MVVLENLKGSFEEFVKSLYKRITAEGPYRRNPKNAALSPVELQAIAVGAILAEINREFTDSLRPFSPGLTKQRLKQKRRMLAECWGINSPEAAAQALSQLKNKGHREAFDAILANVPQVLETEQTFEDFQRAYEAAGLSIFDDDLAKTCPRELELTKEHIDLFHAMSDKNAGEAELDAQFVKHRVLFDDDAFCVCADIYAAALEKMHIYAGCANRLRKTLDKLQSRGFVRDAAGLAAINPAAWDMGRLVSLARWCAACDYITENTAWDYILWAWSESTRHYANWAEFGRAYIIGRAMWSGESGSILDGTLDEIMDTVDGLLKDETSPWRVAEPKILRIESRG